MDLHKELNRLHTQLSNHMIKTNMAREYKPHISLDSVNHDVDKGRFGEVYSNGYLAVDNFLQPYTLTQLNNFILTNMFKFATPLGAHHLNVEFCNLIYEDIQSVYRELEEYTVDKSFFTFFGYKEDTHLQPNFYDGLQYGNYSRDDNSLNITIDIDTDCDQDTLPVMVYYDIGHVKIEDNETVWNGYMYNNYFFNVTGWEGNEYELTSGPEYFTEPYTGWYMVYVNLYADYDRDGIYDYVNHFYIDEIILEEQ